MKNVIKWIPSVIAAILVVSFMLWVINLASNFGGWI